MSVITAIDSKGSKKPQYKDYVTFLGSYRSCKKDDQCSVATNDSGVSFSLNNSSNNSSSSVNSDLSEQPRNGFKEYLEHYNNKKYSSVQPAFIRKEKPEETKTVKTEVYIEINNQNAVSQVSKVFAINGSENQASNVSKVSKIFEKNCSTNEPVIVKTVPLSGKVNTFKFEQKEAQAQHPVKHEQKKNSIGEISKKFEANSNGTAHKVPLKKTNSISEKSKLFEDVIQTEKKEIAKSPKTNDTTSPKPPINNAKPVLVPKTFQEPSVPAPKIQEPSTLPITPPPPPPPALNIPCPPPQPPSNVPPPPPLPPANPTAKNFSKPTPVTQKILTNGSSATPAQNGKKIDVVDGIPVPVIDKNDPRVKRVVYGALREMYGAYHDKANDYIATLPRNRVKKNNGLDSIINSIA